MPKKWIVEVKGGPKNAKARYKEYDIKLQDTKVFHWWDYSKNKKRPEDYPPASNFKAWFKCDIGHSFYSKIANVFLNTNKPSGCCKSCGMRISHLKNGNSIKNKYPDLIKFWHKEKNLGSTKDYPPKSSYKAWWNCSSCNIPFQKRIDLITDTKTVNCTKCTEILREENILKLPDKYPELKKIWDTEKNNEKFELVRALSNPNLYWWKCEVHGSTKATVTRAKNKSYCEKCVTINRTSEIEIRFYFELKTIFKDIINQKTINKRQVDLFLPEEKIAIEFDGYPWHLKREKRDFAKDEIIKKQNINVLRIRDERLVNDIFPEAILITASEYGNPIKIIIKLLSKIKKLITDKDKISKINSYIKNGKLINDKEFNIKRADFSLADTDRSLSKLKNICRYFAYERNFPLTPEHFTSGSWQRVWWTCEKGHSTRLQIVKFRQSSYDYKLDKMICAKCDLKRRTLNPSNDDVRAGVLFNFPDIHYQYDRAKNGKVLRSDVSANSTKLVWWICNKGHSWQSHIKERTYGDIKHCPKCDPDSWKRKAKKNVDIIKGSKNKINKGKVFYKPWSEK